MSLSSFASDSHDFTVRPTASTTCSSSDTSISGGDVAPIICWMLFADSFATLCRASSSSGHASSCGFFFASVLWRAIFSFGAARTFSFSFFGVGAASPSAAAADARFSAGTFLVRTSLGFFSSSFGLEMDAGTDDFFTFAAPVLWGGGWRAGVCVCVCVCVWGGKVGAERDGAYVVFSLTRRSVAPVAGREASSLSACGCGCGEMIVIYFVCSDFAYRARVLKLHTSTGLRARTQRRKSLLHLLHGDTLVHGKHDRHAIRERQVDLTRLRHSVLRVLSAGCARHRSCPLRSKTEAKS